MFTALSAIGNGIVKKIEDTLHGRFKLVTYAQCTNAYQVLSVLPAQSSAPAAIVCIGDVDYQNEGLSRTIRPVIVILTTFKRGPAQEAYGAWSMADEVAECFAPQALADGGLNYPEVCGIEFIVQRCEAVESSENIGALALTLEGLDLFNKTVMEE